MPISPTDEPEIDEPAQGVIPANALFIARRPASLVEEPTVFKTRAEVESMLKKEKEKASVTSACIDLNPPYPVEIAAKPYPSGTWCLSSRSLMAVRAIPGRCRAIQWVLLLTMLIYV